ncbi:MAG: cytochrome c biogenesis CcdA family protein [Acidimicrobiales bacterium]
MSELFNPIAFTAGMVALVNPCGFALLPAYLGYFLGMNDGKTDTRLQALNRSQLVAAALSLGFLVVFGALGIVFTGLRSQLTPILPWFSMAVGIALVILGVAMLRGFKPMISVPRMEKGTSGGSMLNMFLFGVSYAVASLSCTIGVFLAVVGTSVPGTSFTSQLGGFLSYGAGMGLLATILTLAVGFGKKNIVTNFKKLLPKINFISGLILIPVGLYVFLYGVWDRQVLETPVDEWTPWLNSFMRSALDLQTEISNFIGDRSAIFGWAFLAINAALIILGFAERRLRRSPELDTQRA